MAAAVRRRWDSRAKKRAVPRVVEVLVEVEKRVEDQVVRRFASAVVVVVLLAEGEQREASRVVWVDVGRNMFARGRVPEVQSGFCRGARLARAVVWLRKERGPKRAIAAVMSGPGV